MDNTILIALIGAGVSVLTVILTKVFDLILNRLTHRDEQDSKELTAIKELGGKVDNLGKRVDDLQLKLDETATVQCRVRILRFAEELRLGTPLHTKDHFDQTLEDIRQYDRFTTVHPEFRNEMTAASEELIKASYKERLERNDFL